MKVAFIGHRKISVAQELKFRLRDVIENLILFENANTFLFGSKSDFNDLCYELVTQLKIIYPHIRRIYVRAEFEFIDSSYDKYLLSLYEATEFPVCVHGAGVNSYIKRNEAMIDMCDKLIVYYNEKYLPQNSRSTQSGSKLSVDYAKRKRKSIINLFSF